MYIRVLLKYSLLQENGESMFQSITYFCKRRIPQCKWFLSFRSDQIGCFYVHTYAPHCSIEMVIRKNDIGWVRRSQPIIMLTNHTSSDHFALQWSVQYHELLSIISSSDVFTTAFQISRWLRFESCMRMIISKLVNTLQNIIENSLVLQSLLAVYIWGNLGIQIYFPPVVGNKIRTFPNANLEWCLWLNQITLI
jgi:hypothetical protein